MMILLFFFVLLFYVNVIVSYYGLINLVYFKKISFSFMYFLYSYLGLNVVNGCFIDFIVILVEKFFWMVIDFGGSFVIYEIEVFV